MILGEEALGFVKKVDAIIEKHGLNKDLEEVRTYENVIKHIKEEMSGKIMAAYLEIVEDCRHRHYSECNHDFVMLKSFTDQCNCQNCPLLSKFRQ